MVLREVGHKKEVHKLINYLANEGKTSLYVPFLTTRERKENKGIRRQQISGSGSLEDLVHNIFSPQNLAEFHEGLDTHTDTASRKLIEEEKGC